MKKIGYSPIFTILLILFIWELISALGLFSNALFPTPYQVSIAFFKLMFSGALMSKILYSIGIVGVSMLLSFMAAYVFLMGTLKSKWIDQQLNYCEALFSPLPGMAILPLVILWFGVSRSGMLFIMVHAMLWPIWSQLRIRVLELRMRFATFNKSYAIPRTRRIYYIYFLGSRSVLISAIKVAWGRGWRALISAEMIFGMVGSHTGLGWLIYERRMYMDTAGLYAALMVIALIGIIVERFVKRLELKYGNHY